MKKTVMLAMLVVGGIAVARGLDVKLREVCRIYIGTKSESLIYCHGKWMPISLLKDAVKEYVSNVGGDDIFETPEVGMLRQMYAVIALQAERGVKYKTYFAVQNEISKAYNELRNELAYKLWSCSYNQLQPHRQSIIRMVYPIVVSDVEPRSALLRRS